MRRLIPLALVAALFAGSAAAVAKPVEVPVATIAAAEKAYKDAQRSAEAVYRESVRLAGTKEAVAQAQAKALADHATSVQQARERYALLIATARNKGQRQAANQWLNRELREIDRVAAEALKSALLFIDPEFAKQQAERVRAESLAAAQAAFQQVLKGAFK